MKLYETVPVDMTYQNFGSAWLGVLRGPTEQIELTFNGLFNLCATNGRLEYKDHLSMVAVFWTDRRAMRRFFFNRYFIPRCMGNRGRGNGKLVRMSMRYAWNQLATLNKTSHEAYLNFTGNREQTFYSCGKIGAERPDTDMKDAIIFNAFKEKESKPLDAE
jgi:hypothetical protein